MPTTDRTLSWPEVDAFVSLIAAAFKRDGRNPTDEEVDEMVALAREIVATSAGSRMVH